MNPHLSDEAREFGEVAAGAFAAAGGVDLARRVEADPALRATEVAPLLDRLGAPEVDARSDLDAAEAAAALCRAAGRVAFPYPVVPLVLGQLALVAPHPRLGGSGRPASSSWVDHGDLFDDWRLATIEGAGAHGSPDGSHSSGRLGPFVGGVSAQASHGPTVGIATPLEVALHLTLTGFVVTGALAAALDLATAYVVERVQFDKPLSAFQAVQFQLADAHVAVASVDEVVQFALWRCHTAPDDALADALAARLAALDAARVVLRSTQQLHGAAGLCDEYDVSILVRHLQPALRLPFGAEAAADHLATAIASHGFVGLFDHGGTPT